MNLTNHQFRLSSRPVGMPKRSDWNYTEEPVREPGNGEFLAKVLQISLDPAMRGWMSPMRSYIPPVGIGEVMRALATGRVIASNNPNFGMGDHVGGLFGVQEYAISNGLGVNKVDTRLAPLPKYLSVLGMPGMTAYFGFLDTGAPQPGNTVVVSAASGAVGSVVGQIAKIKGCRAVGIAGSKQKCEYVSRELGFDAAIDYKSEDVSAALRKQCPNGIDVYFDNVGGDILDTVLTQINLGARIVICGAISQYNNTTPVQGPSNYFQLLIKRATMKGMLVTDFIDRYPQAAREMAGWMAAGKLKSREDIVEGMQNFPEALVKLFTGENFGKLILKVSDS